MSKYKKAMDEFFEGEGKPLCDMSTLTGEQYLYNRIWRAFLAGMNAGERIAKAAAADDLKVELFKERMEATGKKNAAGYRRLAEK